MISLACKVPPYSSKVGHNVRYSVKHGIAEWICLAVCFLQIKLTDFFLNGAFIKYGPEVRQMGLCPGQILFKPNPRSWTVFLGTPLTGAIQWGVPFR